MARKYRIYAMVTALGLTALILDRTFFQATAPDETLAGPSAAQIDLPPQTEGLIAATGSTMTPAKLTIPELRFPRGLPSYNTQSPMRDLFAPANQNLTAAGKGGPGKTAGSANSDATRVSGRAAFAAAHRVDALMIQERLKIAVIDGRWMQLGDQLDECTLSRIEGEMAIFQCHDGEAQLSTSRKKPVGGD